MNTQDILEKGLRQADASINAVKKITDILNESKLLSEVALCTIIEVLRLGVCSIKNKNISPKDFHRKIEDCIAPFLSSDSKESSTDSGDIQSPLSGVMHEIKKTDKSIIAPLTAMTAITKSDISLLEVVHKDICNSDIIKTIEYLKEWYTNHSINLKQYMKRNK